MFIEERLNICNSYSFLLWNNTVFLSFSEDTRKKVKGES